MTDMALSPNVHVLIQCEEKQNGNFVEISVSMSIKENRGDASTPYYIRIFRYQRRNQLLLRYI